MKPEAVLVPILPEEAEALLRSIRREPRSLEQRRVLANLEALFDLINISPVGFRPDIIEHARTYVYSALKGLLEMSDHDGLMMPWSKADHEAVMHEVNNIKGLFEKRRVDRRTKERRTGERRQKVGERTDKVKRERTPEIRRTKPGRRYFKRRG